MTTHENHEGVAATQFRRPCDKRLNFINDTVGGAQSEQWGESPSLSTESVPDSSSSTLATAAARECVSQKAVGVSEGKVIYSCGRGTNPQHYATACLLNQTNIQHQITWFSQHSP